MTTEPALRRQFRNFHRQKLGYRRLTQGTRKCWFGTLYIYTIRSIVLFFSYLCHPHKGWWYAKYRTYLFSYFEGIRCFFYFSERLLVRGSRAIFQSIYYSEFRLTPVAFVQLGPWEKTPERLKGNKLYLARFYSCLTAKWCIWYRIYRVYPCIDSLFFTLSINSSLSFQSDLYIRPYSKTSRGLRPSSRRFWDIWKIFSYGSDLQASK